MSSICHLFCKTSSFAPYFCDKLVVLRNPFRTTRGRVVAAFRRTLRARPACFQQMCRPFHCFGDTTPDKDLLLPRCCALVDSARRASSTACVPMVACSKERSDYWTALPFAPKPVRDGPTMMYCIRDTNLCYVGVTWRHTTDAGILKEHIEKRHGKYTCNRVSDATYIAFTVRGFTNFTAGKRFESLVKNKGVLAGDGPKLDAARAELERASDLAAQYGLHICFNDIPEAAA